MHWTESVVDVDPLASDARSCHTPPPGRKIPTRLILRVVSTRREVREDNCERFRHGQPSENVETTIVGFFLEKPARRDPLTIGRTPIQTEGKENGQIERAAELTRQTLHVELPDTCKRHPPRLQHKTYRESKQLRRIPKRIQAHPQNGPEQNFSPYSTVVKRS
jgi:hypothetical protein